MLRTVTLLLENIFLLNFDICLTLLDNVMLASFLTIQSLIMSRAEMLNYELTNHWSVQIEAS